MLVVKADTFRAQYSSNVKGGRVICLSAVSEIIAGFETNLKEMVKWE